MPSQGTSTFDLFALRFHFAASGVVRFPPGETANLFRGEFGKVLHRRHPALYERFFAPVRVSGIPSGLHDPPRPFAFRVRHLDGAVLDRFFVGLNWFETSQPEIEAIGDAIAELASQNLRAEFISVEGREILHLPLTPSRPASRVRVYFLSPTELKPAGEPDFGRLFSRVRDRIATLRALYGEGPLEIDFHAMGKRARAIRMTRCEIHHERIRRATGPRHPLGGFLGEAEYEGDLTEFIPYLNAAQYTGVGRQTVWGKGEISIETF
ncbi:MAG TPA: CRISPR system precrRNA processing endoribonuclease RAMP protein Cas6 [Bryobacteraceae bacterium]|nr:CRISPR system precrRNA processing endoribonuclease RAMP protein Cas6 [Bryobacteraceae bacterium]